MRIFGKINIKGKIRERKKKNKDSKIYLNLDFLNPIKIILKIMIKNLVLILVKIWENQKPDIVI